MGNVFVRTVILYLTVVVSMRLMGKRQLGELQPSELVIAIMISDVASVSLQSTDIPLLFGIIPVLTLVCLEMILSFIGLKSNTFRKIVSGKPCLLIRDGVIDQAALKKLRITLDDLFEELRLHNVTMLDDVKYAFVETNGQLSIIQNADSMPAPAKDAGISVSDNTIPTMLIRDGKLIRSALTECGRDERWLADKLHGSGCTRVEDVFLMRFLGNDTVHIVPKAPKGAPSEAGVKK